MATSFHLYKKSTFPPLLDSYLPVDCRNQNGPNQKTTKTGNKERMINNERALTVEEKDEIVKQALQEQRHLETYKNLYKLRDKLAEHYRALLNEKVRKQRIQMKKSNLQFQQHIKLKEKMTNSDLGDIPDCGNIVLAKYVPSRKVRSCTLSHDLKYLESIPLSGSYLGIGLQNELTKLGILKTQQDYEHFWKLIQKSIHHSELKEKLSDIKAKMLASESLSLSASARTNPTQLLNGLISSSRLKKTVAFSELKDYHHSTVCGSSFITNTASLLQSADICHPSTHHMNQQMKTQQDTRQTFSKNSTCTRKKKREQHLDYLHHMYYLSLLNMASSKRLLEQNGQFSDIRKDMCVHDLMDYLFPNWHEQSATNRNKMQIGENKFPTLVGGTQRKKHNHDTSNIVKISPQKKTLLREQENKAVAEIAEDQEWDITSVPQHKMITVPLTLEDVALYHPTVEAKSLGTFWTNYAHKDSIINSEKC